MNKKLSFNIFKYNHAPYVSQVLAILSENEMSIHWKMSYFLHMRINRANSVDSFYTQLPWIDCPFIEFYDIPTILVKNHFNSFVDFLRESIDLNCYVLCGVNMCEIPEYKVEKNSCHDPMIMGIDDEREIVYMADFYRGVYEIIEVSFTNINNAFKNLNLSIEYDNEDQFNMGKISLFRILEGVDYSFNLDQFKKQLIKFLSGANLFYEDGISLVKQNEMYNYVFGIYCYDYAINIHYTFRILSLFVLRSYIWKLRLEYFEKNNIIHIDDEIYCEANDFYNAAKTSLYLYIYYSKSKKDEQKLERIKQNLIRCKYLESKIINYVLKQ